MARLLDLTGMKVGRLTVLRMVRLPERKGIYWECHCDCGAVRPISAVCLRTGKSKSCGCFRREMMHEVGKVRNLRHGEGSNGKESAEYRTWCAMLSRCKNINHRGYSNYGGRGIQVCDRWDTFENFLADMGRRPSDKHSLDRIDNNGHYSPENCRWATSVEQNNNQRRKSERTVNGKLTTFEHQGKIQSVVAWCKELGVKTCTFRARRRAGMTIEQALLMPLQKPGRKPRIRL